LRLLLCATTKRKRMSFVILLSQFALCAIGITVQQLQQEVSAMMSSLSVREHWGITASGAALLALRVARWSGFVIAPRSV
jgi:hypothetical protein